MAHGLESLWLSQPDYIMSPTERNQAIPPKEQKVATVKREWPVQVRKELEGEAGSSEQERFKHRE